MSHISFSELKNWNDCPYKHKLVHIDKIKEFVGNEYTAFGKALHTVCEEYLLRDNQEGISLFFEKKFLEELSDLQKKNVELKNDLIKQMRKQGNVLAKLALPALRKKFTKFEVCSVEEKLMEPIENFDDYKFKGFIDLAIKTPDGKYHVIDWKTCSWGWDSKRKSDKMTSYQLTLYKHYFASKHKIDPSDIKTHFALLKRTAKKNQVEIFEVSSGAKKTKNALKLMENAIYNITNKKHIKNRLSCTQGYGCEFYNTIHCR